MNKPYKNNNIIDISIFQVGLNDFFSSTGPYLRANLSKKIIKCKKKIMFLTFSSFTQTRRF